MNTYVDYFTYLDALRESGVTNMFGARSYVEEEFGLSKAAAGKVLSAWMRTFGKGDKTPAVRAALAEDK
jgi:hypothetical protein